MPPVVPSHGHSDRVSPEVILALAGLISSIGAILATFFGSKGEDDDCRDLLKLARMEAEEYARELHDVRMREP